MPLPSQRALHRKTQAQRIRDALRKDSRERRRSGSRGRPVQGRIEIARTGEAIIQNSIRAASLEGKPRSGPHGTRLPTFAEKIKKYETSQPLKGKKARKALKSEIDNVVKKVRKNQSRIPQKQQNVRRAVIRAIESRKGKTINLYELWRIAAETIPTTSNSAARKDYLLPLIKQLIEEGKLQQRGSRKVFNKIYFVPNS